MGISLSFEVKFILLAFAGYRVAALFTQDDGPASLLYRLRIWAGVYDLNENGEIATSLGKLFDCAYCFGMYAAIPALLILIFVPFTLEGLGFVWVFVLWFSLAGAQSVLETFAGRAQGKNIEVRLDAHTQGTLEHIAERLGE